MLIKTQLRLVALLPVVFALLIGSVLWFSWIKIDQARQHAEMAEKALLSNFELNILTQEYLLYGGARIESQLRIRHQSMGELLAQLTHKYEVIEEQELVDALRQGQQEMSDLYALLLAGKSTAREQIAGALLVKAQAMRAKTRQFADIQYRQVVEFQRLADKSIMGVLIVLAVCSIALLALLTRRLMQGINELAAGMRRVEAGNLQHSIPIFSADELGALAQVFNGMTRKLLESYTSIDNLKKEIAGRRQAEQTLLESESKYRRLIENSPDIAYTFSVTRGTIYCSSQATQILGYSVEDLYANPFLWNESIHPDDRAVVAKAIKEFKIGAPFKIEYRIKDAHGDWRWFYDRAIGGREGNGESIIEGLAMDITVRKRAEAKLLATQAELQGLLKTANQSRQVMLGVVEDQKQAGMALRNSEAKLHAIIENLTEGIAVSDLNGQLLHFNRAALDLHGFTTLDECRQHLSKFADTFELSAMDGTVLALEQWPLARVLRGESLRDLEVYVRHLQAGWKRIYSYGGTLVRDDGQPLMAVLSISDITERKQAEAKLAEQVDDLRRWHDATIGREMRVLELKHEVNELLVQTGQPPRYHNAESDNQQEK